MTKKAKVYGSSLYDLASEEGLSEVILSDLRLVCNALDEIPDYSKLLSSPAVPKSERKELLSQAWKETVNQYTLNFLCLLCDGEMISSLPMCAEEYKRRYDEEHNILQVKAITAIPLTEDAKARLAASILERTGKKAEITVKVDEKLIGGMRLEMDGISYDGSISYHMDALRKALQENK